MALFTRNVIKRMEEVQPEILVVLLYLSLIYEVIPASDEEDSKH